MFGLFDYKGAKVCEDFCFWLLKGGAQKMNVILRK
jgi:hypothetical protein